MQYKISVLVFIRNEEGKFLLLKRKKSPNLGMWSPIGGKLEMDIGESPFECAIRETQEETGFAIENTDLHLFCMAAEKAYEGSGHWLMFLFECKKPITHLPEAMEEGDFDFFERDEINTLPLPETDSKGLWPIYDQHHNGFVALKADCHPEKPLDITIEQSL